MIITKTQRKMIALSSLINWFIIYSFFGWIYETIYCSFTSGKFVNRGFLYGPFCPIYGITIVLMIIFVSDRCKSMLSMFIQCAIVSSTVEYISSYWMELVFGRRWWNYSDKILNLNGRVCIEAAVLFGIFGIIIIRFLHPMIVRFIERYVSEKMIRSFDKVVCILIFFDILISFKQSFDLIQTVALK